MSHKPQFLRLIVQCGLVIGSAGLIHGSSPCDLNNDGVVNAIDIQLITNMALGVSSCGANIIGAGVCNWTARSVVVNAALGLGCHSVSLNWTPPASLNIAGYNVYRGTSAGNMVKINSALVQTPSYVDASVQLGQTYYYAATSVDTLGNESAASNQAQAIIPSS